MSNSFEGQWKYLEYVKPTISWWLVGHTQQFVWRSLDCRVFSYHL